MSNRPTLTQPNYQPSIDVKLRNREEQNPNTKYEDLNKADPNNILSDSMQNSMQLNGDMFDHSYYAQEYMRHPYNNSQPVYGADLYNNANKQQGKRSRNELDGRRSKPGRMTIDRFHRVLTNNIVVNCPYCSTLFPEIDGVEAGPGAVAFDHRIWYHMRDEPTPDKPRYKLSDSIRKWRSGTTRLVIRRSPTDRKCIWVGVMGDTSTYTTAQKRTATYVKRARRRAEPSATDMYIGHYHDNGKMYGEGCNLPAALYETNLASAMCSMGFDMSKEELDSKLMSNAYNEPVQNLFDVVHEDRSLLDRSNIPNGVNQIFSDKDQWTSEASANQFLMPYGGHGDHIQLLGLNNDRTKTQYRHNIPMGGSHLIPEKMRAQEMPNMQNMQNMPNGVAYGLPEPSIHHNNESQGYIMDNGSQFHR